MNFYKGQKIKVNDIVVCSHPFKTNLKILKRVTKIKDDRKLFLEEKRISNGKKFIHENSALFGRVEDQFGVPREIITSILGVETRYGKIKGSYRVLDSLATLSFDFPRRSKFFTSELIQFFILTRENNLDINSLAQHILGF